MCRAQEPVVEKEFTDSRLELVEGHDELTWALYQYVTATVLPFLLDYYDGPESSALFFGDPVPIVLRASNVGE
eukprot:1155466-Rhodomonas_salina.2